MIGKLVSVSGRDWKSRAIILFYASGSILNQSGTLLRNWSFCIDTADWFVLV